MVHFKTSFVSAAALAAGFVNAAPQYGYAGGASSSANAYGGSYSTSTAMADMSMSTSSVMMEDSSSSMMMEDSSSMMMDSTSTMMMDSTSTSSAYNSYSTSSVASYGSGSMSWGSSGYNDCVQQCIASFGAPMATYTASATSSSDSSSSNSGSSGSGSTHTVIVAPTQGVLRYVPFALNASVGDTVEFVWHANTHTVTHSSELEVCNKTLDDPFTSGIQNESFTFTQVINSTDPTFFYCGVPTHCQKGMFGIINPPSALVSNMSVGSMMPTMVSNDSTTSMMNTYMQSVGQGSSAESWGSSIDMTNMPPESYALIAQNVLYTRTFLAANPDYMQDDGSVNLGASGAPMVIPQDLSAMPQSANAASAPSVSSSGASSASSPAGTAGAASGSSSGARSLAASSAVAAFVAVGSAFLLL